MSGELTSLAFCWTIERRDGAGLALTSHDRDLVIGGKRHRSQPGMMPSAIERGTGIGRSDCDIAGAVTSAALSTEDLTSGRWDGARIRLSIVDWATRDASPVTVVEGELADVESDGPAFRATLAGATSLLSQPACPETSSECRAMLGDPQCRVDMAGRQAVVTIVDDGGDAIQIDRAIDEVFLWGSARFLSGANTGFETTTIAIAGDRLILRDSPRAAIRPGDRIELRHGCDKRFATCRERFANAINFRGEPHLPGNDLLTRFPGA